MKKIVSVVATLALSVLVAQFAWAGGGVLLVDDDGNNTAMYTDVRDVFETALQDARLVPVVNATKRGEYQVYEIPDTTADGPDSTYMRNYEVVIWFTGQVCCQVPNCISPNDEVNLAAYLDSGGKLFLSAQDYLTFYGSGSFSPGDFPYDYLKIASCVTDQWQEPGITAIGDSAAGAITEGLYFEVVNPFTKGSGGSGQLFIDEIEAAPAKGVIAEEFYFDEPDSLGGFGYTSVSWTASGSYVGTHTFFSSICLAALEDGPGGTKGELMSRIMSWFLGDYADYGDAPDPPFISMWETTDPIYGIPNAGARHENSDGIFEWLGDEIDLEFNSWQVDQDLHDDGVVFTFPYTQGGMGSVDVTVRVSDYTAGRYILGDLHLHGWFDWNGDGDFLDTLENVFCSVDHNPHPVAGENWGSNVMTYTIDFPVPDYVVEDDTIWTRFRLDFKDDDNWDRYPTSYGEVEDYAISRTGPLSVGLSTFYASAGDRQATLYWTTESEVNNLGFYLTRSAGDGRYVPVNDELIPGHGTSETRHEYSYTDQGLVNDVTYSYKLVDIDMEGTRSSHGPISVTPQAAVQVPTEFALSQNYPNPFNARTTIAYAIPKDSDVSLKVFNVLGEEIRTLVDGHQKANAYQVTWDGKDADGKSVASGVYFCTLKAGEFSKTTKMVFLK